jgi:hypothetical protein
VGIGSLNAQVQIFGVITPSFSGAVSKYFNIVSILKIMLNKIVGSLAEESDLAEIHRIDDIGQIYTT